MTNAISSSPRNITPRLNPELRRQITKLGRYFPAFAIRDGTLRAKTTHAFVGAFSVGRLPADSRPSSANLLNQCGKFSRQSHLPLPKPRRMGSGVPSAPPFPMAISNSPELRSEKCIIGGHLRQVGISWPDVSLHDSPGTFCTLSIAGSVSISATWKPARGGRV